MSLTGCSSNSSSNSSSTNISINVFASTNVWGSVVKAVGGPQVSVTSAITKPEQDPHNYEVTAQDKLAAKSAKLTIVNGGGYDDWATKVITSSGTSAKSINAVDVSGLAKPGDKNFNEHVFFSIGAVQKIADKIAADLGMIDSKSKQKYLDNATAFSAKLDALKMQAAGVGTSRPELTAVATEPVVGYLLADMGIDNVTPANFVAQSESDAGPSAATLNDTVKVITEGKAKLLVLNGQTEDSVSSKLSDAATGAAVPIVKVYETFPAGVDDYIAFMSQTVKAFSNAAASVK
ncbi:MAG: zinc ABC transporter substrate-binding protein [Antricoccus sp.]